MKKAKSAKKPNAAAVVLDHYVEMQQAIHYAESANWHAAEAICKQIVAKNATHIDAINMLGVVAIKLGRLPEAVQLMEKLIRIKPDYLNAYINLGMVLREMGNFEGAARYSRQALKIDPNSASAYSNLGNALLSLGRPQEAVEAYEAALKIQPNFWDALNNLNVARRSVMLGGQFQSPLSRPTAASQPNAGGLEDHRNDLASLSLREVPARDTKATQTHAQPAVSNDLGAALQRLREQLSADAKPLQQTVLTPPDHSSVAVDATAEGDELRAVAGRLINEQRHGEAEPILRQLIAKYPEDGSLHCNLASELMQLKRHDDALPYCRRAVQLAPDLPEAHNNLGLALCATGEPEQALSSYDRALQLRPGFVPAMENRAIALRELGRFEEAAALLEDVLRIEPERASAHYELGLMFLHSGRFSEGFREYEWRRRVPEHGLLPLPQPEWDGQPFPGRRLLVHPEQGLGDAIHFARYLPKLKAMGGTVLLRSHPPLLKLFETLPGVDQLISSDQPLPQADLHISLLSLARFFTYDESTIPTQIPYVFAQPSRQTDWTQRLGQQPGLKVGLVWSGNPEFKNDRNRSLRLDALGPLASVPGITFVSLQKGPAAAQAAAAPSGMELLDFSSQLDDFADTAALISCLDLVISVDTAVAHLAGALGIPVWTLLPLPADWRWLTERDDTPWYPSMRLFRQSQRGDWGPVIQRVAGELQGLASAHTAVSGKHETPVADWLEHVACYFPDGASIALLGNAQGIAERLPAQCSLVSFEEETLATDTKSLSFASHILLLDDWSTHQDMFTRLERLREIKQPLILVTGLASLELSEILTETGWHCRSTETVGSRTIALLSKGRQIAPPRKRIALIATKGSRHFSAALRLRLVNSVLPPGTELSVIDIGEIEKAEPHFDLAIVGTGGDLASTQISEGLIAFLEQVPRAIGLFGIRQRDCQNEKIARLLDRLFLWGARHEQDVLLYGRGRGNVLHFGDWLIDAFPMASGTHANTLQLGNTAMLEPAENVLAQLRNHHRAAVGHPDLLLAALCHCAELSFHDEQNQAAGRFRALLIDVLGRSYAENETIVVDREAVMAYKARTRLMIDELRKVLAIALGIPSL